MSKKAQEEWGWIVKAVITLLIIAVVVTIVWLLYTGKMTPIMQKLFEKMRLS